MSLTIFLKDLLQDKWNKYLICAKWKTVLLRWRDKFLNRQTEAEKNKPVYNGEGFFFLWRHKVCKTPRDNILTVFSSWCANSASATLSHMFAPDFHAPTRYWKSQRASWALNVGFKSSLETAGEYAVRFAASLEKPEIQKPQKMSYFSVFILIKLNFSSTKIIRKCSTLSELTVIMLNSFRV